MIEIICPCSKEELARFVQFLYHGEIQCEDVFDSFKSQEDLSRIFGFPENFNVEFQIATLIDDPALSSIIDVAVYEEVINTVDDEIITQSSEIDFNNQDIREPKIGNEVCSNLEYANDSVGNEETVEYTIDETTMVIHSKSISQDSRVDKSSQTEVEIDLNNNTINEMNAVKPFSCHFCDKSFNHKGSKKKHINSVHLKLKPFSCQYCGKSFANKTGMERHVNVVHLQVKPFSCQYCEKSFWEEKSCRTHLHRVHLKTKPFSCQHCEKSFNEEGNMKRHISSVHFQLKPFSCQYCEKSFGHKDRVKNHVNAVHLKSKPFSCQYCDKSFANKSDMERHINVVHLQVKPFSCQYCEKSFWEEKSCRTHLHIVHLKTKPFSCQHCEKSFNQEGNMKRHISSVHFQLKPFSCLVHAEHLKIKPFSCQQCEKSFGQKDNLRNHVNAVHLKIKSYSCQHCDKSFGYKKSLRKHMNDIHLKKFNCSFCRIFFIQKSHFKQHIEEIHKNLKPLKCVKPDVQGPLVFLKKLEVIEEETTQNTVDDITIAIDSERNSPAHGSMVHEMCPTEVEINLNNNLVNETNIGCEVDENLGGALLINDGLHDNQSISNDFQ